MMAIRVWLGVSFLTLLAVVGAQAQQAAPEASTGAALVPVPGASVPRLVKFAGVLKDSLGQPRTGVVGVTFALYKEQEGGAPLWLETQNVELDAEGRYTVLLGAETREGLPLEVFATGEARWLEILVHGEAEGTAAPPRVLVASVPYALKAADAETLGGKPASAFVLAAGGGEPGGSGTAPGLVGWESSAASDTQAQVVSGTVGRLAKFTAADTVGDSVLFESSGNLGLGTTGPLAVLHVQGNTAATGGVTLRLANSGTGDVGLHFSRTGQLVGTEFQLFQGSDNKFKIGRANVADFFAMDPSGNVGIGTTTPTARLDVVGNVKASGSVTAASFAGNGAALTNVSASNLTAGTYSNQVTFSNPTNSFTGSFSGSFVGSHSGDGAGLTNVTAGTTNNLTCTGCVAESELDFAAATQAELDVETAARVAAVNVEAMTRANADATLQANIDAEAAARQAADAAEAGARQAADAARAQLTASNTYQSSPPGTLIPQVLGPVDTATAMGGFSSNPLDLAASAFSTTSNAAEAQTFRWQVEPVGSGTEMPSGKLSLLFAPGAGMPTEKLSINADGTLNFAPGQAFPGLASQSALDAEAAARQAADTTLQSNIDAEVAARGAADTSLTTNLNNEIARAQAAEAALQTNLDAETAARVAADAALTTSLNNEIARAQAAEATLQSNLDAEALARQNADTTLQNNLDAEAAARVAADATLQTNLDAEAAARLAADTSEATVRANADAVLQVNIDAEADARVAADNAEAAARQAGDAARAQLGASNTYQSSPVGTVIPQVLGPVDVATALGGFSSNPLDLAASVFNGSTSTAETPFFRWQVVPKGNSTANPSSELLLSQHPRGINVVFADGSVRFINQPISPSVLQALTSPRLDLEAAAINSATAVAEAQTFSWQVEPVDSGTPTPSGKLNLLFGSGMNPPLPTGLEIAANGIISFAPGQVFPGTTGVNSVTAGDASITIGGTPANPTVAVSNSGITAAKLADGSVSSAKLAFDPATQAELDAETAARVAADTSLTTNLNNEIARAQAAEATLQSNLDAEALARQNADTTLQNNIDAEVAARMAADAALQASSAQLAAPNTFAATQTFQTSGATEIVVRAATGQTANLQEWQNAAGNPVLFVSPAGSITATGTIRGARATIDTELVALSLIGTSKISLPATGMATMLQAFPSGFFDVSASAFNSGSSAPENQTFRWQAEAVGSGTMSPSAKLSLQFAAGTAPFVERLSINADGTLNFAPGQTFSGTFTGTASNADLLDNLNSTQFLRSDISGTLNGDLTVNGSVNAVAFSGDGLGLLNVNAAQLGSVPAASFARRDTPNTFTDNQTAPQFVSNVATGTAPFQASSTTKVANLNTDQLDGFDWASFPVLKQVNNWTAGAGSPQTLKLSGTVTDAGGQPINATVDLTFRIFAAATGGTPLYAETHPAMPVVEGHYSVVFGSVNPLPADLFSSLQARWLEVVAGGFTQSPRLALVSVPFALAAKTAESAGVATDLTCAGCVSVTELDFDPATQTELDNETAARMTAVNAEAAARAAADAILQTDVSGRVSKAGDTMTGALTLPANGLVLGTNQLVAAGGKVGIGTAAPATPLQIATGDVYLSFPGSGLILTSSAGTCARLTVTDGGAVVTTVIPCP